MKPTEKKAWQRGVHTYSGSCHCGAVRYDVDVDLASGTGRCNCTICTKSANWGAIVKPEALRVLQGADALADYSRTEHVHIHFCGRCGIRVFSRGNIPEVGGAFASVNLNTLDGVELDGVPVRYFDGLHDTWEVLATAPQVSPFRR